MGTLLVVDDEVMVRELYAAWLRQAGHTVHVAGSVMEAQELLQECPVDVLFTDIRMTQATGIDLLAWAREHDPDMPVILITGVPEVETAVEALRLGAYDYMLKPVSETALQHTAEQALQHRQLVDEKRRLEEENRRYQQHLEELVAERTAMLERRTQQLLTLHRVAQTVTALQNVQDLYQQVVNLVHTTFGYPTAAIFTVDWNERLLHLAAAAGMHTRLLPAYRQSIDEGLLGQAARGGRPVVVQDVRDNPQHRGCAQVDTKAEAIFPVRVEDTLSALLLVGADTPNAFDETDQVVLHTLTEHLSVAMANTRLYEQVREALVAREQMLQNVSHELRTPLTLIRGYAELMADGAFGVLSKEAQEAIQTIVQQTIHLTDLVNQLIMFQQVKQEMVEVETIALGPWLREVTSAWTPTLQEKGMRLHLEMDKQLGNTTGNSKYLTQVMNNLLDNACKFSPHGGTVTVRARRNGRQVIISVSDQGIGVSPDKLPRLFERFYQVEGGISRRFGGMGLGLSLAKEIVERHGGRIWAESEGEGKGLTVTFTLPLTMDQRA